jgi:TetR/AcrR family transcriptional repressor of nem operon
MRYSSEHKAETHRKIVRKAAEQFRLQGLDGIGIAPLMSTLGLTHGGFYEHFKGKNGLIAEASVSALEDMLEVITNAMNAAPKGKELQGVLNYYLSPAHRDHPGKGCALPAIAADLARRPERLRQEFTRVLNAIFEQVAKGMPGESAKRRKEQAMAFFSGMVGTVLLARVVSDREMSDALLESGCRQLQVSLRE